MFKVGDLAVYPAHGVGVIERIENRTISGCQENFYVMRILDTNMIIMIPSSNTENVGLRQIINQKEVTKVFSILHKRDISVDDNQTWNRRYRDYMDKIKSGSVYEVAEVYRDLCAIQQDKELSFGERKMLDTARGLLVKEISLAKNMREEDVEKDIQLNLSAQTQDEG
ncbi:MAG: CarD family transcriptional regulator [Deltaproteobacteria bacterium]|nr:CarD family transcriptional regulator [Deltaproteobacteria bacterium]MBW2076057.1 CarD family transcriptional regulator [Deltaproteobacteria bacterium]MBW2310686.1 CarD family transcriptional regulator [Deltaproteobacteria bacterium]RLB32253.1 MAG: CarD family transcriptional regulator [Deltaproteobacteria bacterium]